MIIYRLWALVSNKEMHPHAYTFTNLLLRHRHPDWGGSLVIFAGLIQRTLTHCCGVHLEEFSHILWLAPGVLSLRSCGSEPMDRIYCASHLILYALSMACTCCGLHLLWLALNMARALSMAHTCCVKHSKCKRATGST